MRKKKGQVEKIRLFEGDTPLAEQIAQHHGLDRIQVLSFALSAGLKALEESPETVPSLGLKFKVIGGEESKNAPPAPAPAQSEVPEKPKRRKAG